MCPFLFTAFLTVRLGRTSSGLQSQPISVQSSTLRELVDSLHQRNVKVFLISGGFRCIVEHVATQLDIPLHHVYANRLKFYFNGNDERCRWSRWFELIWLISASNARMQYMDVVWMSEKNRWLKKKNTH